MANPTYYVNALTGNDGAAGNIGAPWLTISRAVGGNNRNVLLATGMCYDTVNNTHIASVAGTPKDGVFVDAYIAANSPNSDYPIFECGFFIDALDAGWTNLAGYGVWKKAFGSVVQGRVFVGAINSGVLTTQRSLGIALRRATMPGLASNPNEATILAAISPSDPYYCASSAASYNVYIYTGRDDVPPPLWYGGLYICGINFNTQKGAASGYTTINATNMTVMHSEVRGAYQYMAYVRSGSGMGVGQDSVNILFKNMKATACMNGALTGLNIAASPGTDPGYRNRGVRFENIEYNLMTNENEQEPDQTYSYISSASNAFTLGSGSEDCSLYKCVAKNPGHKAYYIGDVTYGYSTSPQRCVMSYCDAQFDVWTSYANWASITDGQGHSAHHNTCSGSTSRVELSGGVHFYKNEGRNFRLSTRKPGTSGAALSIATGGWDWNNALGGGLQFSNSSLIDVRAEQNTFEGVFTHAFEYSLSNDPAIQGGVDALFPANMGVIRHNVVLGTFSGDVNHTVTSRFLVAHNQYPAGWNFQLVQNNVTNISNPNATDECYTNYYDGGPPNYDGTFPFAMNGMTGSTGNTAVSDPKVDSVMNPLPTSPLIGTATFIGYMPDIRGVQESNPPSKGARAYQAARTSRLT